MNSAQHSGQLFIGRSIQLMHCPTGISEASFVTHAEMNQLIFGVRSIKCLCHGCDHCLHDITSKHQTTAISSYMGCPSAIDFLILCGFELSELESSGFQDWFASTSCGPSDPTADYSGISGQSSPQLKRLFSCI